MLLLLLTALYFCSVKGFYENEEVCYGRDFRLPLKYQALTGMLYFTPRNGGEKIVVMNGTRGVDPRYKVTRSAVTVPDVTERDEGTFTSTNDLYSFALISTNLRVKDCAEKEFKNYGQRFSTHVSSRADYVEFSPSYSSDKSVVLWNRTDPHNHRAHRGTVQNYYWEMEKVTQADNGYYSARRKDRSLYKRWKLTVKESKETYEKMSTESLLITAEVDPNVCTVTFQPEVDEEPILLVKSGFFLSAVGKFMGRIRILDGSRTLAFEITDLQTDDSGLYEITDQAGNLALVVHVTVLEKAPTFAYIGIGVGVFLGLIFCCCCVRKCCCGKSSSKGGDAVPQTEEAGSSQPALTAYSPSPHPPRYTNHPMTPINSPGPTASSINPPNPQPAATSYSPLIQVPRYSYNPTNPINPSEPSSTSINPPVAPPGGQGAAPSMILGSDSLSSTAEHRFELKGLRFPSAPPLSSDSAFPNVYNSDKLNFC